MRYRIFQALDDTPEIELRTVLARRVPLTPILESDELDFLFMSKRAYRFNPAGVACVYFTENERVARAEYLRHQPASLQPFVTFFADVYLRAVLDLCSPQVRKAVGLSIKHTREAWADLPNPTHAQLLGLAVSQHKRFSAIRFASEAARAVSQSGFNVVIFRDAVRRPDFVQILGPTKKPLQKWP